MIQVQCKCGQVLQAPAELAGKPATCPKCKQQIVVPGPVQQQAAQQQQRQQLQRPPTPPRLPPNINGDGADFNPWESVDLTQRPINQQTMPLPITQVVAPQQDLGSPADFRLGVAGVLSFFVPGLGQVFKRQVRRGLSINATVFGLLFIAPVLIFGLASVAAPSVARDSSNAALILVLACLLSLVCWIVAAVIWRWQVFDAAGAK